MNRRGPTDGKGGPLRSLPQEGCGGRAPAPEARSASARVGKGGGFSDLEYALLAETGQVTGQTPILTTVHPLQMVPQAIEMLPHDIPVDVVVTPDGPIPLTPAFPRPRGVYREALSPEKIAEVPVLQELLGRR